MTLSGLPVKWYLLKLMGQPSDSALIYHSSLQQGAGGKATAGRANRLASDTLIVASKYGRGYIKFFFFFFC